MVAIKPKTRVVMELTAESVSHARTDVSVRDLTSTIDEPTARGGTNQGCSPTETLMAALLGCTNVIGHKIAAAHGIEFEAMRLRLEATFDRRGVTLQEEIAVPFPKIKLFIDVTTGADAAAIETVERELGMYCPVSKVIRAAGTEIEEVWTVHRP